MTDDRILKPGNKNTRRATLLKGMTVLEAGELHLKQIDKSI